MFNRASHVADKFIAHFSKPFEDKVFISPWKKLIETKDEKKLIDSIVRYEENRKEMFVNYYDYEALLKGTGFVYLTKGHHNEVWQSRSFEGKVFKYMDKQSAIEQLATAQKAHAFVSSQEVFWCKAPLAQVIDIPKNREMALYVEEKLPLCMNEEEHKRFLDKVFIHLLSSDCSVIFKDNMFKLVKQICDFIEKTGFWDVGLGHNLPEFSFTGTHICVTDFEKVDPENKDRISEGIKRLAVVFCLSPFSDYLSTRHEVYCPNSKIAESILKAKNQLSARLSSLETFTPDSNEPFCSDCCQPVSLEDNFCEECCFDLESSAPFMEARTAHG